MTLQFTLLVEPKSTQHGARAGLRRGKIRFYNDSEKTAYQTQIVLESKHHAPPAPLEGPLQVRYRFFFGRPKSWKPPVKWVHPHSAMPYKVKPDVVNLAKGTEDALTKAGFWVDDKQVVSLTIEKWYVELDPPRIEVTIETL